MGILKDLPYLQLKNFVKVLLFSYNTCYISVSHIKILFRFLLTLLQIHILWALL